MKRPESGFGGGVVAQTKRIVVSVPDELLASMDDPATRDARSRSAFVREAIRLLVRQRQWLVVNGERLRRGYQEMGALNRRLAEEGLADDLASIEDYERRLGESESG